MPALTGIKKKDSLLEWYFRGFADELSPMLRHTPRCQKKPSYYMTQYGVNYNRNGRSASTRIISSATRGNLSRIPAEIREAQNLPLLLETAVELARRKGCGGTEHCGSAGVSGPGAILAADLPDRYGAARPCHDPHDHGRVLLLGNTCLTLEMAYLNARLLSRPVAHWLTDIVEE